jgi:hypothetical protein
MGSLWSADMADVQEREDLMTISVPGSLSTPTASSAAPAAAPAPAPSATAQADPKAAASTDTVKLSQAAQVRLLKQQGQLLSQIATNLSIPIATVDGYLGIQAPKPTATPAPAQQAAPSPATPSPAAQPQGPAVASEPPAKA